MWQENGWQNNKLRLYLVVVIEGNKIMHALIFPSTPFFLTNLFWILTLQIFTKKTLLLRILQILTYKEELKFVLDCCDIAVFINIILVSKCH